MKTSDLVVGQDYALRSSKYDAPWRALVLDAAPTYDNASRWAHPLRHPRETWVRLRPFKTGRIFVAVETDAVDSGTGQHLVIPYAARPQEIVEPWADYAEREAARAAEREAYHRLYEAQQAAARAEMIRKGEENRLVDLALRLEFDAQRAVNLEAFDAEVAPVIAALGGYASVDRWTGRASVVRVDLETLRHLCRSISR